MAISPETRAFALELFEDLPDLTSRAMMGGLSIYSRGQIFAILGPGDRIYIKAKGALAESLAAQGSEQFAYEKSTGKIARMGYWTLPENALDDPEEACDWALKSLEANAIAAFP